MWYVRILVCCRLLPFAFANIPSRFAEMSGLPHCTNRIILAIRPFATVSCPSLPLFILPLLSLHSHAFLTILYPHPETVISSDGLFVSHPATDRRSLLLGYQINSAFALHPSCNAVGRHARTHTHLYTLMTPRAKVWWTLQTFLSNETFERNLQVYGRI